MTETNEELIVRYSDDLARVSGETIPFELRPFTAVALVGQLQLALRHPENQGQTSARAREFIQMITTWFVGHGCFATVEVIRRGDDPQFDVA